MIALPIPTGARILIVDDESSNVLLLEYLLRAAGYTEVRSTTDPREAMALFEAHRPDLILLDLSMPHLDGFELMRLIGERVSPSDCLPILVLTADVSTETKHLALQAGACDFLTKPFDHVEALLRIHHLLHRRSQHQLLARQKETLAETVAERTIELRLTCSRLEETLDELRRAQQQMIQQERMSALGTMAAGLAHDFNNSLSLILGYSELLQGDLMGTPYETNSDEFLGTIITAAQDAAKMFNRLRTFYRAQDDTEDKYAGIDLNALAEQAVALTRPRWHGQALARGADVRLVLDLAPGLPSLLADAAELREMLTNLIFNAVDAMPRGGTITLRTRPEADRLILEVSDTGMGMDEDTRRRCLEPFFTTKGERGTGLGLAMVYGTIQRHEGNIDLHSVVGEGTRFTLKLPLRQPGEATAPGGSDAVGTPTPRRVLVVDDQPVFVNILHRYLTEDGHTVDTAADGREALEKFRVAAVGTVPYELVITDQGMPGMCGEQLAAEIKALAPATRVILISGYGDLDATGPRPGVDLSLVKPLTHAALRTAVRQATAAAVPAGTGAGAEPIPFAPPLPVGHRTRLLPALQSIHTRLRQTLLANRAA